MSAITQPIDQDKRGIMAILFAAFLWGTTGTTATFAPQISPLAIGAFAMGLGGLLQALFALKPLITEAPKLLKMKSLLLLGALSVGIYPLAFYSSMHLAGVAMGTVISIATAPLASVIIEQLSGKPALSRRWLVSFMIGILGVVLLSLGKVQDTQSREYQLYGIGLAILAGITYASYSWAAKNMIDKGIRSESAMGSIFGLGAVLLLPTLSVTGNTLFASINNGLVVTYMALVPMFIGYLAYGFGLKTIPASRATTLTLFEPLIAAVLAVVVIGEQISAIGWLGMALIFICLSIVTLSEK